MINFSPTGNKNELYNVVKQLFFSCKPIKFSYIVYP